LTAIVIDASAILAVAFNELQPGRADVLFNRIAAKGARVPAIFVAEVANGLEIGRRRQRIEASQTAAFLADLARLPITVQMIGVTEITPLRALAEQYGLTGYDASYLSLAMSEKLDLVTLDAALERAARQAGVAVAPL